MRSRLAALAALSVACLAPWLAVRATDPKLPSPLAGYRSWKTLTASPTPIPFQLAQLCAPALPGGPPASAADRAAHGPHANRWVRVYANPAAAAALDDAAVRAFPVGATIAKEKSRNAGDEHPEGVAFMVKHKAGEFAASGGWEFLYFPVPGSKADYSGCIACHQAKGTKDYVFGSYGQATH